MQCLAHWDASHKGYVERRKVFLQVATSTVSAQLSFNNSFLIYQEKKNSKLRKTVFFSFFLYCFGQQTSIWQSGVVYSERKWRCWLFCVHTNDTCCLSPKHLLTLLLRQEDAFLSCHGTRCWYLVLLSSLSFQVTPWGHVVYLSLPKLVDICRQMIPTLCFIDHTT